MFIWDLDTTSILLVSTKRYYSNKRQSSEEELEGSQKCCFCNANETIKYLLFDYHHAKQIWRIVYFATCLPPSKSVCHMFENWLHN
jgi:hypothetical protein